MKPLRKLLSLAALLGCPFLLWKLAYWYDNRRALALRKEVTANRDDRNLQGGIFMTAQCLYQSNASDLAGMSRQRKACLRAVRKLQWDLRRELASETPPTTPLLMRPAVKEILIGAERGEFNTLLIGSPEDLLCEPQELEALLSVLSAHDIHVFGCQRGRWVEPGGRHFAPLPQLPWAEEDVLPPVEGVVS